MSTIIYRRKSLVVTAEQSADGNWHVSEGGQNTVYTNAAFEALFDKLEMQADVSAGPNADMFGFDYSWCEGLEGRALINELLGIEMISIDNSIDGPSWMYKPYPLSTFGRMLNTVVQDMKWTWPISSGEAPTFTEVGSGVGTKLVLAEKLFHLRVNGFDYNQDYCNSASQLLFDKGCESWTIQRIDARSRDALRLYEASDIVYLNRPFVHLDTQGALEQVVMGCMRSGAYIILANYATEVNHLSSSIWRKIDEDKTAVVLQKIH